MPAFVCTACGVRYPDAEAPPRSCIICEDERQFVPKGGQSWTTLDALASGRANMFRRLCADVLGISTSPTFAIGQRAILIQTSHGNILWDCLSLLDDATADIVRALGGLHAIAVSHPHFYSSMGDWAEEFGCPVLVHKDDRDWVVHPSRSITFWRGETHPLVPGLTLHRLGGHFPGSTVLHWEERRMMLSGDTVQVMPDRRHVSFMWSYPNQVPLPAATIRQIGARLNELEFDSIYGGFWDREITTLADQAVRDSVKRYLRVLETG